MTALYPLFLKLQGKDVLVLGAGVVAEKKIADLVAAGARVRVVAPEATTAIQDLAARGVVAWEPRRFAIADVEGAWLVVAATTDPAAQEAAAQAAE
jgi:siroheme synthase-like protein